MRILGIESSCDETGCAVVEDGWKILSNSISTQIDLHELYGGVVPELACRRHVEVMIPTLENALKEADCPLETIDAIAVTDRPGLVGALMVGVNATQALSLALDIPWIGVNHVEAHLYAPLMGQQIKLPCLGLVVSGGHTALYRISEGYHFQRISQTLDDAAGEAFDKVARLLGLPYPGGPKIEQLAKNGDPTRFAFRAGRVKGSPLAFSFSGIKTALLYTIRELEEGGVLDPQTQADLAAGFQEAVVSDLVKKSLLTAKQEEISTLVVGGGVSCNQHLRTLFREQAGDLQLLWAEKSLALDNAAMIAGLGYHRFMN
ncbi:MAG: tRNA (adenosine(37)-N6)-threonylcarbamoyltransferase complex transferase subunit TsaD [Chlamydiia bacterium]|nr:tRNA (adenosine(37)-N6)-threonylcarbamoyltransferase complex transferase subunit TsaD [Chlamydiia bacterium]